MLLEGESGNWLKNIIGDKAAGHQAINKVSANDVFSQIQRPGLKVRSSFELLFDLCIRHVITLLEYARILHFYQKNGIVNYYDFSEELP